MFRVIAAVGRLVRALAAFVVLAGFTAGVPWLLASVVGWPMGWIGWPDPTQVPGLADLSTAVTNPWSDQMIIALIASIGWVLWLQFLRDTTVEIIEASAAAAAARRGQRRPPVGRRGPIRWVAAVLVGAVAGAVLVDTAHLATAAAGAPSVAAADLAAHRPAVAVAAAPTTLPAGSSARAATAITVSPARHSAPASASAVPHLGASTGVTPGGIPVWARDAAGGTHAVAEGDNLWNIAENNLGDPHRWREIYTLNRGQPQANGYALTDPDEIHVGWILALPAHNTATLGDTEPADPADTPTAPADPAPTEPGVQPPGNPVAGDASAAGPTADATAPGPAVPVPSATPATPIPTGSASAGPSTEASTPGGGSTPTAEAPDGASASETDGEHANPGISLPSQGWVSLGLAALIAALATLLRLQRRRRARLAFPIHTRLDPTPTPVPAPLAPVDTIRTDPHGNGDDEPHQPSGPATLAPIGVDTGGAEVSLFDLPGPGLALTGGGAESAARAVLAAALATGTTATFAARPVVVTTTLILARLLPDGAPLVGLDPDNTSFDGERLIVVSDVAAAVTHAEEEMIMRRRLLDTFDVDAITALNARTDHAEMQPPYVLLIEAAARHAARLLAVGAHRTALDLHPVIVGPLDGIPTIDVAADGTTTGDGSARVARLSTLAAADLAAVLAMLTEAVARPEAGYDVEIDPPPGNDAAVPVDAHPEPIPVRTSDAPAVVRLRVVGPLAVETESGPVTSGMRSGSYLVLACLAVHPAGRTLDRLAADLHPDTDPATAGKRIRTDISTTRRVLRAATGNTGAMFVIHDGATGRYRLDPELITVDLWQMLTAIETANTADDDTAALALLRQAVELYDGDFADGADQTWITDHATTYRHQILSAHGRIAEILEADRPDDAVVALERALDLDPINEELYQRIMRIHGRLNRPDAVRRTLRRLEERLAELGDAEPSQATRHLAERQLRTTFASGVRG